MSRALIIEDEWLIAEHIASLAEAAGASEIDFAATESEAIETARRARPDIIFSDVRLTEGTGPAAVEAIRNQFGPIPTIFVTGNPEQVSNFAHAAAVITKPIMDQAVIEGFKRFAPRRQIPRNDC